MILICHHMTVSVSESRGGERDRFSELLVLLSPVVVELETSISIMDLSDGHSRDLCDAFGINCNLYLQMKCV